MKILKLSLKLFLNLSPILLITACSEKEKILDGKRETLIFDESINIANINTNCNTNCGNKRAICLPKPIKNFTYLPNQCIHYEINKNPKLKWKINGQSGKEDYPQVLSGPVVDNNIIYFLDPNGVVIAANKSGKLLWKKDIKNNRDFDESIGGGVIFDEEFLYVTAPWGELFKIKKSSGQQVWKKSFNSLIRSAPAIASNANNSLVYVITAENKTYAINTADGKVEWEHSGGQEQVSLIGGASPVVNGSIVFSAYSSGEIFAFSSDTGDVIWSQILSPPVRSCAYGSIPHIKATPVVNNNVLYVISYGKKFAAYGIDSGTVVWEKEISGNHTPVILNEWIFLITNESDLLCIDKGTGCVIWTCSLAKKTTDNNPVCWSGIIVGSNRIFAVNQFGWLQEIDAKTGKKIKKTNVGSSGAIPIIFDKSILLSSNNGDLLLMN